MSDARMPNAGPWPAGFTSATLQTKANAFAAEHGLTLDPGQEWAGRFNSMTGEFTEVWPCNAPGYPTREAYEAMRADALRRVAIGLDLPESLAIEVARCPRAESHLSEVASRTGGARVPPLASPVRPVTPSGHRTDSPAYRAFRCARRRALYRIRAVAWLLALLSTVVMVGAFAADRPVAGVLASALVFILLRYAAEARAEL